ncbi:MAG: M28 family peptidase, partial [Planctomycetota bacterium]
AARDLQLSKQISSTRGEEVIDDHRIFMDIGIRSVDLIDFDYGPKHAWWHTEGDKLENCSKSSLDTVGRVVLHALPALEKHLSGK